MNNLEATAQYLSKATCPEDVFGILTGSLDDKLSAIKAQYRQFAQVVHPDKNNGQKDLAQTAFSRLTDLKNDAEKKIQAGLYGNRQVAAPAPKPKMDPITVKVKGRQYTLKEVLFEGDICDLYGCTSNINGADKSLLYKISQVPGNNDLVDNEYAALTELYQPKASGDRRLEYFRNFFPEPFDSFPMRSQGTSNRKVIILPNLEEMYSIAEVLQAYPKGIEFKTMVWMLKRILVGVGYAHERGIIHGAILPPHVLVHPVHHGGTIVDWCYSVRKGDRIKAISASYRPFYAPEILNKEIPGPFTDIYMAAKTAVYIVGGDVTTNQVPDSVPKEIQDFLGTCLQTSPLKRPNNAWDLHDQFNALLERTVGKRKYTVFEMPERAR